MLKLKDIIILILLTLGFLGFIFSASGEELRLIGEYTPDTPTYDDLYDVWKDRIDKAKEEDNKSK